MLSPLPSLQGSELREQSAAPFTHGTCNIAGFSGQWSLFTIYYGIEKNVLSLFAYMYV